MANQFEDLNDIMDTAITVALNAYGHVKQIANINANDSISNTSAWIQNIAAAKNSEYEENVTPEPPSSGPSR